jgi:hypothetical protein
MRDESSDCYRWLEVRCMPIDDRAIPQRLVKRRSGLRVGSKAKRSVGARCALFECGKQIAPKARAPSVGMNVDVTNAANVRFAGIWIRRNSSDTDNSPMLGNTHKKLVGRIETHGLVFHPGNQPVEELKTLVSRDNGQVAQGGEV